jgi:hypothetical protein
VGSGLVFASLVFSSLTALADDHHKFELDAIVGGHVFSDRIELGVTDDTKSNAPENFVLLGARAGYSPLRAIALEAEVVAIPTSDRHSATNVFVLGARAQLVIMPVALGPVHPFVLLGGGALKVFGNGTGAGDIQDDTDLVPHGGLGVTVRLGHDAVLRLEGRGVVVPTTGKSEVELDIEAMASVGVTFGGKGR